MIKKAPLPIVILISGNGGNLQAFINAIEAGNLNAEIKAVISNRPNAYGLTRALNHNLPAICIDHKIFENRHQYEKELKEKLDLINPKLIVLAGFMRILGEEFVRHFNGKIINIHPSLLPKYKGLDTYQRALDNKETEHGATVHYVTNELDSGPVILQEKVKITKNETAESLQKKVQEKEYLIYPQAVQLIAETKC